MIPIVIVFLGIAAIVIGLILLFIVFISPSIVKIKNILGQLELSDIGEAKQKRKSDRRVLTKRGVISIMVGTLIIIFGWTLGYNQKGDGFWFNQFISGDYKAFEKWDRLSEDGNFISNNGTEYPYYLLVNGNTYEFSGEVCEDLEDVKNKLSKIKRENTVIIIDSYAVSSRIKEAEKLLTEMGIKYEMEEV